MSKALPTALNRELRAEFGRRLHNRRMLKGFMSADALAAAMSRVEGMADLNGEWVRRAERGGGAVELDKIAAASKALGCDITELLPWRIVAPETELPSSRLDEWDVANADAELRGLIKELIALRARDEGEAVIRSLCVLFGVHGQETQEARQRALGELHELADEEAGRAGRRARQTHGRDLWRHRLRTAGTST